MSLHFKRDITSSISSNGDSVSVRSHVTTPTLYDCQCILNSVQVPVKSLSYQMRIHLLEEILSYVQTTKSCELYFLCFIVDHISWTDICNRMAVAYHITISPEEAKSIWDSIAYGSSRASELKENESDDELIFQTEGKPFHLEQYFKRHYKQGSDVNRTTLLSIDYPDTISGNDNEGMMIIDECDMISIQKNCPLSIIPLRNYSYDSSSTTTPINKLDTVLEMISKRILFCLLFYLVFSISVADIRSLWGTDRIKELEAVLNDIDLLSAESQQKRFY